MLLNATRIRILSSHDLRAEQRNMPCRAVQLMELNVLITTESLSKGWDIKFIINVYDIFNLCRFDLARRIRNKGSSQFNIISIKNFARVH